MMLEFNSFMVLMLTFIPEQEELINDLRKQTIKTDMQFLRVVQVIVGFSLSL